MPLSANLGFSLWLLGSTVCSVVIWVSSNDLSVEDLSRRARSNGIRGNGFELKDDVFRLDLRKKFFTIRVVKYCLCCPERW